MIISLLFSEDMIKTLGLGALVVAAAAFWVDDSKNQNKPTYQQCYEYGQSLLESKTSLAIGSHQRGICDIFLRDSGLDIDPDNNETTKLKNWLSIEVHKIDSDILDSGRYFDWENDSGQLGRIMNKAQTFDDVESVAIEMRAFMESVAIHGKSPYFTDTAEQ